MASGDHLAEVGLSRLLNLRLCVPMEVVFKGEDLRIRSNLDGREVPAKGLIVEAHYRVGYDFVPFALYTYQEEGSGQRIAEIATAKLNTPEGPARISVVFEPGKEGQILFSRDEEPNGTA